jgi:hypothetical protein
VLVHDSPNGLDDTLALKIGDFGHLDDSPPAQRKLAQLRNAISSRFPLAPSCSAYAVRQRSVSSASFSERTVRP